MKSRRMYALWHDVIAAALIETFVEKLWKEQDVTAEKYQFACERKN